MMQTYHPFDDYRRKEDAGDPYAELLMPG